MRMGAQALPGLHPAQRAAPAGALEQLALRLQAQLRQILRLLVRVGLPGAPRLVTGLRLRHVQPRVAAPAPPAQRALRGGQRVAGARLDGRPWLQVVVVRALPGAGHQPLVPAHLLDALRVARVRGRRLLGGTPLLAVHAAQLLVQRRAAGAEGAVAVAQHQHAAPHLVLEVVVDAPLLRDALQEVQVRLVVLHLVVAHRVALLQPPLDRVGVLVQQAPQQVAHVQVLVDAPARARRGQEQPRVQPQLELVVALVPAHVLDPRDQPAQRAPALAPAPRPRPRALLARAVGQLDVHGELAPGHRAAVPQPLRVELARALQAQPVLEQLVQRLLALELLHAPDQRAIGVVQPGRTCLAQRASADPHGKALRRTRPDLLLLVHPQALPRPPAHGPIGRAPRAPRLSEARQARKFRRAHDAWGESVPRSPRTPRETGIRNHHTLHGACAH